MFSLFNKSVDPIERSAEVQQQIDAQTAKIKLYHYDSCPFCARVRSTIDALALNIEYRNTQLNPENSDDLLAGGGRRTVPALRIEQEDGSVYWMYESSDIMRYLDTEFAA
ncbi:MAG: glutathione S-transferase [Cellvibrionaceae bacterium]|jgi:glutathione S-transferase